MAASLRGRVCRHRLLLASTRPYVARRRVRDSNVGKTVGVAARLRATLSETVSYFPCKSLKIIIPCIYIYIYSGVFSCNRSQPADGGIIVMVIILRAIYYIPDCSRPKPDAVFCPAAFEFHRRVKLAITATRQNRHFRPGTRVRIRREKIIKKYINKKQNQRNK